MVIKTLLSNALAPTVALYFLDMVFVLLTVRKTLIAVHLILEVFVRLRVVVLLDRFILLETP